MTRKLAATAIAVIVSVPPDPTAEKRHWESDWY
jgi:hypothetical protein